MKYFKDWKTAGGLVAVFLVLFFLPVGSSRFDHAVLEALHLTKWYAREHVLLCLIPAFFIAGAIAVFIRQASVMKYLGAGANKVLAYGVASVAGTILAVCSCTVLPLFAGIYRMGAGLGPATAFLYSGPAINVLAIVLTARVLGPELGIARAVGAIFFSVIIGLIMHFLFRREEAEKAAAAANVPEPDVRRPLWQNAAYFAAMVGVLVFANWGRPESTDGFWHLLFAHKWWVTGAFGVLLAYGLGRWFQVRWWKLTMAGAGVVLAASVVPSHPAVPFSVGLGALVLIAATEGEEMRMWLSTTWDFTKQILPLLLAGVLLAGFALGRPGEEGMVPSDWVARLVGGNSVGANFFAALVGAFMYFATLTEVPIVQGLMGSGMGQGPALALLLAGPALSLPNMLVIRSVMGTKKTAVYVALVVVMATVTGLIFGVVVS